jgi:hypothetical protein
MYISNPYPIWKKLRAKAWREYKGDKAQKEFFDTWVHSLTQKQFYGLLVTEAFRVYVGNKFNTSLFDVATAKAINNPYLHEPTKLSKKINESDSSRYGQWINQVRG